VQGGRHRRPSRAELNSQRPVIRTSIPPSPVVCTSHRVREEPPDPEIAAKGTVIKGNGAGQGTRRSSKKPLDRPALAGQTLRGNQRSGDAAEIRSSETNKT
jgi:hypothetical protein